MAKVRNGALPSPSPERCVSYERLSGGLNLWELDYRLRRSESPEMKNLIWRDGTLNCRDGQVWLNETVRGAGHAMADRPFHGFLVFHAGTKLYACDRQTGTVSLLRSGLFSFTAAFVRVFVRVQSVPPMRESFTGRFSPAPIYLLTMSSCVAGT